MSRHELSVREVEAGGDVVDAAETPRDTWAQRRRVILFVHGYNNTLSDARAAYAQAIAGLSREAPVTGDFPNGVCRFFWPGDADLGLLSFISYPVEIEDATESAKELEQFLRRVYDEDPTDARLTILAHSLGCRVALELVERLRGTEWFAAALEGVCLMAAAVDVDSVAVDGPLHEAARLCSTRGLTILTSDADWVLHDVFPLGSTLAEPGSGRALGRFGPPPGLPATSVAVDSLTHGDYWRMDDDLLRRVVAEAIGIASPGAPPLPRPALVHETAPARAIDTRELPAWEPGAP